MPVMRWPALLALLLLLPFLTLAAADPKPAAVEKFAQCLAEKKATMYGAFWCSHCDDQKKLFGDAWKHVPYVECAVRGTRQRTEACTRMDVKRTPTWIFADGERREGLQSFEQLSQKTGCKLP